MVFYTSIRAIETAFHLIGVTIERLAKLSVRETGKVMYKEEGDIRRARIPDNPNSSLRCNLVLQSSKLLRGKRGGFLVAISAQCCDYQPE